MNAVNRTIVAFVSGACIALLILYGLALLIDRDSAARRTTQAHKSGTSRPGTGQRSQRMVTVVHAPRPRPTVAPQSEKKPPKPVEDMKGQVVETARPEHEKRSKHARYLGRYDMQVEREQKSRGRKRQGRDLGHLKIDRPSQYRFARVGKQSIKGRQRGVRRIND